MATPILATKLFIPPTRPKFVSRPRLIQLLNEGLHRKLTLISAPAGFGKTTLVSEWLSGPGRLEPHVRAAWLSLDEEDSDPSRFLTFLIAALQTISPNTGAAYLGVLQSPQPPAIEPILTALLNEIAAIPERFVLVLDDYYLIDARPAGAAMTVDDVLIYMLAHLPPQMHLVISTREDPALSLAQLRARGQLTELRAADLRFTLTEAADFLNQVMGLDLSTEDVAALEARTEGWIAGLQLAAISIQGQKDASIFIQSFTGSHRFVLDYLVEEVLGQQPESIQDFLLRTSILNRLCGPLCDAIFENRESRIVSSEKPSPDSLFSILDSQGILEYLDRANLFIVPLDDERRWYRYHHLFADLLRQRLQIQSRQRDSSTSGDAQSLINTLHIRASQWYEENGLELEAFLHAASANDVDRAARLIGGKGISFHFRGPVTVVLDWLGSLSKKELEARPWLLWRYASLMLVNGQTIGVEEKLSAAETALQAQAQGDEPEDESRNFTGQIAAARSVLALTRYDVAGMLAQSRRALEHLSLESSPSRSTAFWTQGYAYILMGNRGAARQSLTEAVANSQAFGDLFTTILATIGLGNVQEMENELHLAAQTYRRVLEWAGDQPLQIIYEAHLGLARVLYEWNDLEAAEQHGRQSLLLARQYERIIDRFIVCEVFLARLKIAQGDLDGAGRILAQAGQSARQQNFMYRLPEVAAEQVRLFLYQGNLTAAAHLIQNFDLPLSQARVLLAQGEASAALGTLETWRQQVEEKDWKDEKLKIMVLQAIALQAHGEEEKAVKLLGEALALAEPEGFIRIFIDEGAPITRLLYEAAAQGILPDYAGKLLAAYRAEEQKSENQTYLPKAQPLIEPLSQREIEVLQLIAQGLSNHEISERLFLALSTVKGHNRKIFDKLQVQRRTEAVARARELGLV